MEQCAPSEQEQLAALSFDGFWAPWLHQSSPGLCAQELHPLGVFRVWGLGFIIWGLGFRVWGFGFRVEHLLSLGSQRVWGLGLGFRSVVLSVASAREGVDFSADVLRLLLLVFLLLCLV